MAGGQTVNRIARWNGSSWSALGWGTDDAVFALTVHGDALIVGGDFRSADGANTDRVARWDGTAWSTLGSGVDNVMRALGVYNGELIAGGRFGTAGGITAPRVAKWNGVVWLGLGSGISNGGSSSGIVLAFGAHGADLAVGGTFSNAGGTPVLHMARWRDVGHDPIFSAGFDWL